MVAFSHAFEISIGRSPHPREPLLMVALTASSLQCGDFGQLNARLPHVSILHDSKVPLLLPATWPDGLEP